MTNDGLSNDMDAALESSAKFRAIIRDCKTFLTEHDADSFAAINASPAATSYEEQVALLDRSLAVVVNNLSIIRFAEGIFMRDYPDLYSLGTNGLQPNVDKTVRQAAIDIVRRGQWQEPWTLLFEREFPSFHLSEDDIAQAQLDEAALAARLAAASSIDAEAIERDIMSTLISSGYSVEDQDSATIGQLLLTIGLHPGAHGRDEMKLFARQAANDVVATASDPAHPAWTMILNRHFPI